MSVGNSAVLCSTGLALLLCALCTACGGGTNRIQADPSGGFAPSSAQPDFSMPAPPPGVEAALWEELVAELERSIAVAPRIELARVTDLDLSWLPDDRVQATWEYDNPGDYDLNGVVNISDLVGVALHFGVSEGMDSWPAARVADGNGDGEVNLGDVSVIGAGFGNSVDAYYVMAGEEHGSGEYTGSGTDDGEMMALILLADAVVPPAGGLPRFSAAFPRHAEYDYYWAAPVDLDTAGTGIADVGIFGQRERFASDRRGDWYMQFRDGRHSSTSALPGPQNCFVKWQVSLPGWMSSQPVYNADGLIFIGCLDGLHAITPEGKRAWVFPTNDPVESTPAIGRDGYVYFGCNDAWIYAVGPDGELGWRLQGAGPITTGIAVADDGTVYTGLGGTLIAAIKPDGELKWVRDLGAPLGGTMTVCGDGTLIAADYNGAVRAYSHDGDLRWPADFYSYYTQGKAPGVWPPSVTSFPIYEIDGEPFDGDVVVYNTRGSSIWMMPVIDEIPIYYTLGLNWVGLNVESQQLNLPTVDASQRVLVPQVEDGLKAFDVDMQVAWEFVYPEKATCNSPATVDSGGRIFLPLQPGTSGGPGVPGSGGFVTADPSIVALAADGERIWEIAGPGTQVRQQVVFPDETLLTVAYSDTVYSYALFAIGGSENNRPPDAPKELSAHGDSSIIELWWYLENGATGYELYRDTLDDPYQVFEGLTAGFTDEGLEGGEVHTYWLVAVNSFGASKPSPPATGFTYLESPASFAASDGEFSDRIELTWTRLKNATGYKIRRDFTYSSPPYAVVGDVAEWSDTSLTDWDEHTYSITAFNEFDESWDVTDTGSLKRGTGDTGPGTWRQPGKDTLHSYRAESRGPATAPDFGYVDLDPLRFRSAWSAHSTVFGSANCRYVSSAYGILALNPDGTNRWHADSYKLPVVLDDGALAVAYSGGLSILNPDGTIRFSDAAMSCYLLTLLPSGDLLACWTDSIRKVTPELNEVWSYDTSADDSPSDVVVDSAGNIYFGTSIEGRVVALSPDGEKRWDYIADPYIGDMHIGGDGSILVCSRLGNLYSLSPAGEKNWWSSLDGKMAIQDDGGLVLADSYRGLRLLDPADAAVVWDYDLPPDHSFYGQPIIDAAGNIYATYRYDESVYPYYTSSAGVMCADRDGNLLWQVELDDETPRGLALDETGTLWLTVATETSDGQRMRWYWFR